MAPFWHKCGQSLHSVGTAWYKRLVNAAQTGHQVKPPEIHFSGNACGFNWSAQHLREVYSQESEIPKFFAGVD
jgi:hypothetical protein